LLRFPTYVWVVAWLALSGLALPACVYKPKVPDGSIRCDDNQRCPMGSICHAVRDGAAVLLVCCKTLGCEGVAPRPAGARPLMTEAEAWSDGDPGDDQAFAEGDPARDDAPPVRLHPGSDAAPPP
jgi:hypothetical protein